MTGKENFVGPVLTSGRVAEAVVEAIREQNESVIVRNRGSYLRVLVADRCVVSRRAIEEHLGSSFRLPEALERIMPSFKGRLRIAEHTVEWTAA